MRSSASHRSQPSTGHFAWPRFCRRASGAAFAALMMACLVSPGCGDTPESDKVYRDLPVEFDGDGDRVVEQGMTLGILLDDTFVPLDEGDPVEIINGFQGGTWVHLSLRVAGMPANGLIRASLGDISEVRYGLKLVRTEEGYLESYDIPLPVRLTEPQLAAIYGSEVDITATFEANGESVAATRRVSLVPEE